MARPNALSFDDAGRAAYALAHLPDMDPISRAALAWTCVNFWRAIHEDEDEIRYPLSTATEVLIEFGTEGVTLAARARSRDIWQALSALASAIAPSGDDPSRGATHFHHGSIAPDWALSFTPSLWLGRWAFYRGTPLTPVAAANPNA